MTEAERSELRALIEARIIEAQTLDSNAGGAREVVELDQSSIGRLSRMDAIQQQAMAKAASARRQNDIGRLRATLGRFDDPDVGFCTECGEEIPVARLRIDPTLARCADCTRSA